MAIIYEPQGRAREYAALAANLYSGCSHGCVYCYAPTALRRDRAEFHDDVRLRDKAVAQLEVDCAKLGKKPQPRVLMSFSTDPYHTVDGEIGATRRAIEILHRHGLCVQILTKGGLRASRDFDLLSAQDAFASTLTFVDPADSKEWEPNAALPEERFEAMVRAHARGIPTWASLEPVIDPEQTLEIIRRTRGYVDLYKVGTLNYHPKADEIDWSGFARAAIGLLERFGKDYYLKRDLCQKAGLPYHERPEAACRFSPQAASTPPALSLF